MTDISIDVIIQWLKDLKEKKVDTFKMTETFVRYPIIWDLHYYYGIQMGKGKAAYMQRRAVFNTSDSSLQGYEKVIIALCDKIEKEIG